MDINIENADNYFSTRLNGENWFNLSNNEKLSAINTAINRIKMLQFIGTPISPQQTLPFPRFYKYKVIQIPEDVVKGIFEEAFYLSQQNEILNSDIPNDVQSISLGSASISFNKSFAKSNQISKNSYQFIERWLKKGYLIEPESFREVY